MPIPIFRSLSKPKRSTPRYKSGKLPLSRSEGERSSAQAIRRLALRVGRGRHLCFTHAYRNHTMFRKIPARPSHENLGEGTERDILYRETRGAFLARRTEDEHDTVRCMRNCTVFVTGKDGQRHEFKADGSSLFDVAYQAISRWCSNRWWVPGDSLIEVHSDEEVWRVRSNRVSQWYSDKCSPSGRQ